MRWQLAMDEAKKTLRKAGLRCTAARIAIVQCLDAAQSPATPLEIGESLHEYGFDKSTIYRSLTELTDAGIVVRLELGDSVRRFELAVPDTAEPDHPHFMCTDCGEVTCLSDVHVELRPSGKRSPVPGTISEVLVRGHCHSCLTGS